MTCPQTQKSAGAPHTWGQVLEAALDAGLESDRRYARPLLVAAVSPVSRLHTPQCPAREDTDFLEDEVLPGTWLGGHCSGRLFYLLSTT